ncbi:hypothetical protein CIG19_21130 [Enterobacterales bacterium CwR94]|nr:hypothetical protein CIG19_21130 [Enterobacterales bacterium CwR94]
MKEWRKWLGWWLLFNVAYFFLGIFSLETRDPWSLASPVWLPAGLVLGLFCTSPRTYWPLCGVSIGFTHTIISLFSGRSLDVALTFTLVELAVLLPLAMMWHTAHHYLSKVSLRTKTISFLLAILLSSIIGGIVGILILMILGYPVIFSHFFTWSLANATGCVAVAPFFIFHQFFKTTYRSCTWEQLILILSSAVMFWLPPEWIHSSILKQLLIFITLGAVTTLAISLPLGSLAIYFFSLTLMVSLATFLGYGPFVVNNIENMSLTQLYIFAVISFGLILAVYLKEGLDRAKNDHDILSLLCNVLDKRKPILFELSNDFDNLHWRGNRKAFGVDFKECTSFELLLAHIHPADRESLVRFLKYEAKERQYHQQCIIRILLAGHEYLPLCCTILPDNQHSGIIGLLIPCE